MRNGVSKRSKIINCPELTGGGADGERGRGKYRLVIDDSVQAKILQVLDGLRVVVVVAPAKDDQTSLLGKRHLIRISQYVLCVDINALNNKVIIVHLPEGRNLTCPLTRMPEDMAKYTAAGIVWHRGSWYIGYLEVTPWVRNITGYFVCLYFTLKRP